MLARMLLHHRMSTMRSMTDFAGTRPAVIMNRKTDECGILPQQQQRQQRRCVIEPSHTKNKPKLTKIVYGPRFW
jgi:hypothetical protein